MLACAARPRRARRSRYKALEDAVHTEYDARVCRAYILAEKSQSNAVQNIWDKILPKPALPDLGMPPIHQSHCPPLHATADIAPDHPLHAVIVSQHSRPDM